MPVHLNLVLIVTYIYILDNILSEGGISGQYSFTNNHVGYSMGKTTEVGYANLAITKSTLNVVSCMMGSFDYISGGNAATVRIYYR